jgi:hypothetical protein
MNKVTQLLKQLIGCLERFWVALHVPQKTFQRRTILP